MVEPHRLWSDECWRLGQAVHDPGHRGWCPLLADHLRAADVVAEHLCAARAAGRLPQVEYWILARSRRRCSSRQCHPQWHLRCGFARGLQARSITLFIFGGVSNLSGTRSPRQRSSWWPLWAAHELVLADWHGRSATRQRAAHRCRRELPVLHQPQPGLLQLIPGFPLDGGRVLRAILGHDQESQARDEWASNVGKLVAVLMALFGVGCSSRATSSAASAAATGFPIQRPARACSRWFSRRLAQLRVRDVARAVPVTVAPGVSVMQLVERYRCRTTCARCRSPTTADWWAS